MVTPAERKNALLALLLLVPAPSIGTIVAMHLLPGSPVGRVIFFASKAWVLALPLVWHLYVDRQKWSWSPARKGGFGVAAGLGLMISAVIFVSYFTFGRMLIDPVHVKEMAAEMGLDSVSVYLLGAAYWCTINSVLEEYVWRWFVFRKCEVLMGGMTAVFASAFLFTVHHFFAVIVYFDWLVAGLCCLGVFIGGAVWSWLYLKYRSIWPPYLSHAIVDVAVFVVGYLLFFG